MARKLLRQIEASEERAEIIEARMAKALSRAGASAEEPPATRHEAP